MNRNHIYPLGLLLILIFTNCSTSSQPLNASSASNCEYEAYEDQLNLVQYKLKGKVKEVKNRNNTRNGQELEILRFNEEGFLIGEERWDKDRLSEVRVIRRDDLKRVVYDSTFRQSFNYFKNELREPFWEVDTNLFDEAGRMIRDKTIRSDGQNSEVFKRYNSDGCIEFESYLAGYDNSFTETTYMYNEQKKVKAFLEKRKKGDQITETKNVNHFENGRITLVEVFQDGIKTREYIHEYDGVKETVFYVNVLNDGSKDTTNVSVFNEKGERVEDLLDREKGIIQRYEEIEKENKKILIQKNFRENQHRSTITVHRNKNDISILKTEEYMGEEISREVFDDLGNPILKEFKGIDVFSGAETGGGFKWKYEYEKDQQGNWIKVTQTETKNGEITQTWESTREIVYW